MEAKGTSISPPTCRSHHQWPDVDGRMAQRLGRYSSGPNGTGKNRPPAPGNLYARCIPNPEKERRPRGAAPSLRGACRFDPLNCVCAGRDQSALMTRSTHCTGRLDGPARRLGRGSERIRLLDGRPSRLVAPTRCSCRDRANRCHSIGRSRLILVFCSCSALSVPNLRSTAVNSKADGTRQPLTYTTFASVPRSQFASRSKLFDTEAADI